ncbi:MAG TPA: hypothetical protein VFV94_11335 [Polyangiaceae bacterium]|nr:hypothetical protein [Polyangiaceae bacterium]
MLARFRFAAPAALSCGVAVLVGLGCDTTSDEPRGSGGRTPQGSAGAPASGGSGSTRGGSSSTGGTHRGGSAGTGAPGASGNRNGEGAAGPAPAGDGGSASNGGAPHGGAAGGAAGNNTGGASGAAASGGAPGEGDALGDMLANGAASVATEPRPAFGAVILASDGERVYAVESRRDVEPGPFGLPWRSRFRVAAYEDDDEAWSYAAQPDDVVSDVIVHPSGDVTIAVLSQARERMAYDLLRFDRDGEPLGTTTLAEPSTTPDADFGSVARPMFRMKSDFADATVGGWVRLVPDGEGLVAVFLSYVDRSSMEPLSSRWALGLAAFDWQSASYAERWARIVEGPHRAQPPGWTYDELRWNEQVIRPFLARDDVNGDLLVGRAWNNLRCEANVAVFAEFTTEDCVFGSVGELENERVPLAVTRYSAAGERLGTVVLAPDEDAPEQLAFALAGHDGGYVVAGAVVRENPDGSRRTYPDANGYVDYDGYIATYRPSGKLALHHDFDLGRGDVLAALRVTPQGILAVGSAGWDRWQGGMSISRGADPLLAWLSTDGTDAATRVLPLTDGSRHYHLHDVVVTGDAVVAHGFSDAPMTHSADGGHDEARTFGALRISLTPP